MIKVGIRLCEEITPQLIRKLLHHPDIELQWIAPDYSSDDESDLNEYFSELCGELPADVSTTPDFNTINLYIGKEFSELNSWLSNNDELKAIILDAEDASAYQCGVAEFNRKNLVRGSRVATQPDAVTMICTLALMPLAKSLLINSPIYATLLLPSNYAGMTIANSQIPQSVFQSTSSILAQLQNSFNSPIRASLIGNGHTDFAGAIFSVDCRLSIDEIEKIYHNFYDDHRHIVLTDSGIDEDMVAGTNKTVISLTKDNSSSLTIAIGFDANYKIGAGNIVHLLNLLFGLDERTAF